VIVFKKVKKTQQTSISQCIVIQPYFCCNIHKGRDALNYFGSQQLTGFSQQLAILNRCDRILSIRRILDFWKSAGFRRIRIRIRIRNPSHPYTLCPVSRDNKTSDTLDSGTYVIEPSLTYSRRMTALADISSSSLGLASAFFPQVNRSLQRHNTHRVWRYANSVFSFWIELNSYCRSQKSPVVSTS